MGATDVSPFYNTQHLWPLTCAVEIITCGTTGSDPFQHSGKRTMFESRLGELRLHKSTEVIELYSRKQSRDASLIGHQGQLLLNRA